MRLQSAFPTLHVAKLAAIFLPLALTIWACDDEGIVVVKCGVVPELSCAADDYDITSGTAICPSSGLCKEMVSCGDDQAWHVVAKCNYVPRDRDAQADVADSTSDAGDAFNGSLDAPNDGAIHGYSGPIPISRGTCVPLESPDCSFDTAYGCSAGSCCECEDLFVCQGNVWEHWGTCDQGLITPRK